MKKMVEENKFEQLISEINNLKIDTAKKEDIIRSINDIEIDYNRLKKSTDMQIDVLEIEKRLLLENYVKKDNDVNYLYDRLMKIEHSKSWKIYQFFKRAKNKVVKIWKRRK